MSTDASLYSSLGPSPIWSGLIYWVLAIIISFISWHFYQYAPTPGLLLAGLTPFINMYLFFRGFNIFYRSILYYKTWYTAKKLNLTPSYGSFSGTFFLLDEAKGLFVANGYSNHLQNVYKLVCQETSQAFRLQIFLKNAKIPSTSIGVHDLKTLHTLAEKVQSSIKNICYQQIEIEHLNE